MFGLGPGRLWLRTPLGTSAEADLDLDAGRFFSDCHKLVAKTHDQRWAKLGDLALFLSFIHLMAPLLWGSHGPPRKQLCEQPLSS